MSKHGPGFDRHIGAGGGADGHHFNGGSHGDARRSAGDALRSDAFAGFGVFHRAAYSSSASFDGGTQRAFANGGDAGGKPPEVARPAVSREAVRTTGALDIKKSVAQFIEQGQFKKAPVTTDRGTATPSDSRSDARAGTVGDRVQEGEPRTQPIEKVKVVYADQSNDPSRRAPDPDFRVKKDGSVEVLSDPDRHNRKEIVVEIERDQGQITGPTDGQRQTADALVQYLSHRFMNPKPDGSLNGTVEDQQGLLSQPVKDNLKTQPVPEANLPAPARRQVEDMQRFSGGGRGTMSPEQADSYFTPKDKVVPRRAEETNEQWSLKETVGGMLSRGEAEPYEAVRQRGDRGTGVGRYLLTCDQICGWLGDMFGDPPDEALIEEAVKKGKISRKMATRIKSPQFKQFLARLKNGEQPTGAEIKENLPKEFQESIAGDLISKLAAQCRDANGKADPGKVALGMLLGHPPTVEDMAKPENQTFLNAAQRLGTISDVRTENPGQPIEWQEVNQRLLVAAKQAIGQPMWSKGPWNAASLEYGNLGCAASVSSVMKTAGVDGISSAGCILLEEKIIKAGGYRVTNPQPGDIVFGRRGKGEHGHVGIVGEDGKVYHNSSAKKYWVEADLSTVFSAKRGFQDVHFVRLPQNA